MVKKLSKKDIEQKEYERALRARRFAHGGMITGLLFIILSVFGGFFFIVLAILFIGVAAYTYSKARHIIDQYKE